MYACLAALALGAAPLQPARAQEPPPDAETAPPDLTAAIPPLHASTPPTARHSALVRAAFADPEGAARAAAAKRRVARSETDGAEHAELRPKAEWYDDQGFRLSGALLNYKTRF